MQISVNFLAIGDCFWGYWQLAIGDLLWVIGYWRWAMGDG